MQLSPANSSNIMQKRFWQLTVSKVPSEADFLNDQQQKFKLFLNDFSWRSSLVWDQSLTDTLVRTSSVQLRVRARSFDFIQVRACVRFWNSRKDQSVGKTFDVSVSKHENFELFHSHLKHIIWSISYGPYGAYRYVASVQLPGGLVLGTLKCLSWVKPF